MTLEELEQLAESGFTAGPWSENINTVLKSPDGNHQMDFTFMIPCPNVGKTVSRCYMGSGRLKENGELIANIKLIAAAPTLVHGYLAAKKREKELELENRALMIIFSAAADLSLSLDNDAFRAVSPVKHCRSELASALKEFEDKFLQQDCRNLAC